jgi:ubiquitin carboxyl-terminal hydrolase 8
MYKEKMKYKDKGLTGLANLGNTCFLNSTLQCLSHTYELNMFLDKSSDNFKERMNRVPESLILWEWDKLRKLMWSENCVIQPGGFLQSVQRVARIKDLALFTGFLQNDAEEFLRFIIDCFHNSLKREVKMTISGNAKTEQDETARACYKMMQNMYRKEYSEFIKLFYGIHVSTVTSLESEYTNITPEPFFNLQVEIGSTKTLAGCIRNYTHEEVLDHKIDASGEGETKKLERGKKKIEFWNLPDILVITLKRFDKTGKKNKVFIDFPLENLNLSDYVIGYDKDTYKYDLYGICNHSGGTRGGHYTSFIKNANDKWYLFNDTNVIEISDLNKIKSPQAYCFFYRKKK